MSVTFEFRDGQDIANSIQRLNECATELGNLVGSSPGKGFAIYQNDYLSAVGRVEMQLRNIFMDPIVWSHLYGDRYWFIHAAMDDTPRGVALITDETQEQKRYIDSLINQLERLQQWLDAPTGEMVVVDTHVLLHFQLPEYVNWSEIVGTKQAVRLILPLRVVEELDMFKYREKDDIAKTARALLSQLWKLLEPTSGGPVKIREGVTIEVPVDGRPRRRTLDADQEILDQCLMLKALGKKPILISDDTGLSIRATTKGVRTLPMPTKYLRRKLPDTDDTGENP